MNCGPLSVTKCLDNPNLANKVLRNSMTLSDLVLLFILAISGHFVCASITINYLSLCNGPHKSCILSHGKDREGHLIELVLGRSLRFSR